MFGMWDVADVGCWRCGMFGMWDVLDVGCSGCGIFGIWDVRDVGCSGCGMFGMWDVQDVGCSRCRMFGMWDVGCGMFAGMWDVDLQNALNKWLTVEINVSIHDNTQEYSELSQTYKMECLSIKS